MSIREKLETFNCHFLIGSTCSPGCVDAILWGRGTRAQEQHQDKYTLSQITKETALH